MAPRQYTTGSSEALKNEIMKRMIQDGEWDRILTQLKSTLSESGWVDEAKDDARTKCKSSQHLKLQSIFDMLKDDSPQMLPLQAKKDILAAIRKYVDHQIV